MKTQPAVWVVWLALGSLTFASVARAEDPGQPPTDGSPTVQGPPDDRLVLSANGVKFEDAGNGTGGLIRWLHDFNPNAQLGLGLEYQEMADAEWTLGALSATVARSSHSGARSALYGELAWGEGRIDDRTYPHVITAIGLIHARPGGFSLQLEDRQIDVDQTHGNLPKIALSYLWSPRLLTSVSYANSVSGNLGTELYATRIDFYGKQVNLLVGGAYGDAAPAVVNLQTGSVQPAQRLREAFLGLSKPLGWGEITVVGDYMELAESTRTTLTVNCIIYLRPRNGSE